MVEVCGVAIARDVLTKSGDGIAGSIPAHRAGPTSTVTSIVTLGTYYEGDVMNFRIEIGKSSVRIDRVALQVETPLGSLCLSWFDVQMANLDWCTVDARAGRWRLSAWTPADRQKIHRGEQRAATAAPN